MPGKVLLHTDEGIYGLAEGGRGETFEDIEQEWVSRFMSVDEFKREMGTSVGKAQKMQPYPGTDRAVLPGSMEWLWEREHRQHGLPVSAEHQEALEIMAAELKVDTPFSHDESSRC